MGGGWYGAGRLSNSHSVAPPMLREALRMNPGELELKVVSRDGSGTVHLVGELDLSTAPQLRRTLEALYQAGTSSVLFDLSELGFVDSTGLSEFVAALKRCRQMGGDVVLRAPTPSAARVLNICGLDRVFTIT